jgi:CBS domain-containing protein
MQVVDLKSSIPKEYCVRADATLGDAFEIILNSNRLVCENNVCQFEGGGGNVIFMSLPVLDQEDKPIGLVTADRIFDVLVPSYLKGDGSIPMNFTWDGFLEKMIEKHRDDPISRIMIKDPKCVTVNSFDMECMAIVALCKNQMVMVVDDNGVFIGAVFGRDLLLLASKKSKENGGSK